MAKPSKLSKPETSDDAFEDMYGSNWLAPDDIKKPFYTTIVTWERQTFTGQTGKGDKDKMVLTLKDVKKSAVLNKTNALSLAAAYGKSPDRWIGKPVLVKVEMTSYQGKPVKGIRLYSSDPDDMKGDSVPL
jgi:hypothetical protein